MKSKLLKHKFPPDLGEIYDEDLANQLAQTQGAIGGLKQTARSLHNPNLLMAPILGKEAESSSQLEGTQASIEDVYQLDVFEQTQNKRDEAIEIRNYEKAVLGGVELLKKYSLNLYVIREVHRILMQGVRGQEKSPGNFRNKEVWIGQRGTEKGDARYIPPPFEHVEALMGALEAFIKSSGKMNPLMAAGILHHRFEAIHPFEDGNGRVGRVLITLFLISRGLIDMPILYPSGYFEKNRKLYMENLSKVDQKEDWYSWLLFFLRGLESQANVSLNLSIEMDDLFKMNKAIVEQESAGLNLIRVLEETFVRPYLTAPILHKTTGIPLTTCKRYLALLAERQVLSALGLVGKQKVYANDKLLAILKKI